MNRRIAAFVGAVVLTGCGPLAEFDAGQILGAVGNGAADASAVDPRGTLTRDIVENSGLDLILVAIVDRDTAATAQLAGTNRDVTTWVTLDGKSIAFRGGLVVGTRGLRDDLMGSDVSETMAALESGGGSAVRIVDYLDSNDQIVRRTFQCTIAAVRPEQITIVERALDTMAFVETCQSSDLAFENLYWRDSAGKIWQSRQWISPGIGYIDHQVL